MPGRSTRTAPATPAVPIPERICGILFQAGEILYASLATRHNIQRYLDIMREIRHAIILGTFPEYLRAHVSRSSRRESSRVNRVLPELSFFLQSLRLRIRWCQALPIVVIFGIFYFLLFLPMQKQKKQQKKMLAELKTGDTVVTNGGIVGHHYGSR